MYSRAARPALSPRPQLPARSRLADRAPLSVPDWSRLSRGDAVRVFRRDGTAVSGHIDMLALDRSVFWVIQEGGGGRLMICSADGSDVVVVARRGE